MSEEHRQKLREAHQRRPADPKARQAWCLKLREANLRGCSDPIIHEAWSLTPQARRWWYAKRKPRPSRIQRSNTVSKNDNKPHFNPVPGTKPSTQPAALPLAKGAKSNQSSAADAAGGRRLK